MIYRKPKILTDRVFYRNNGLTEAENVIVEGENEGNMSNILLEIAKQVDDLVRDTVVREYFRQMIEEYGQKNLQHSEACEAVECEFKENCQAILGGNECLRDKQAGPPDKDWQWKEEIRYKEHYDEHGVCRAKEIRVCGWFPPSKIVVPNNPWPWRSGRTGDLTPQEMLPAQYLLLASCHDCQLSDRPPIITLDLAENCKGVNIYYSYSGRNNRTADKLCRCEEEHLELDCKDVIYDLRNKGLLNEQGKNKKQIIAHATSESTNSELVIFTPEIGEIEIVVEKLYQIQTHKRSYQLAKKRYDTVHFDVDRFARELRIEIPTNRIPDFWQELEDPESDISWPPSVQKLIDDVVAKIEPWWGFIKKYGPDRLRNRKEFKRSLFAVNPEELTWVIRELKKFREIVETKLKQPAPDNLLSGTTTTSGKQLAMVSRGKRKKTSRAENPKKYRPWASCGDACFIIEDNRIKFHYNNDIKDLRLKSESRTHKMLFLLKTGSLQSNEIKDKLCSAKTKPSKIVAYANKTLNEKIAMVGFVNVPKAVQYIKYDKVYSSYHSALKIWLKEDFDRQELQQPLVDDRKFNAKESY